MTSSEATAPKVFVSYSHDSPEHGDHVLALADRLRSDGIDCILDQYEESPAEGFPRWMDQQMRAADFVLMICTPTYYRRVMREEEPGKGHGVQWESTLIYQYIYNAGTTNTRFIPVLLEGANASAIPIPWQGVKYYQPTTEAGYEELYRRLIGQPRTPKGKLGTLKRLPPRERKFVPSTDSSGEHSSAPAGTLPALWNMPYPRNPFFTGRENLLAQLSTALKTYTAMALTQPQAISGLGGIGKTQLAVEYAYHFHANYQAVFWVRADTQENVISDFVTIAGMLNLPEKDEQEQSLTVTAVKEWLRTHTQWLLILDNADHLAMVREFMPPAFGGHMLLTTRAQVMGKLARSIAVEKMDEEVGVLFLLRRAGVIAQDALVEQAPHGERGAALEIVQEMDGLPLALDQAGAYMEEVPCNLEDYLRLYRKQRGTLLKRRGGVVADHPAPVATTWSLSFAQVEQANPAAADLLRMCAFLHPEAIPEELFTAGATHLGPRLHAVVTNEGAFNEAMSALHAYSLVSRDITDHTLSLHRLVQAALKDAMNKTTYQRWATRTVRALNEAFPAIEFETWPQCDRFLPHALTCASLIEQEQMAFPEAAALLKQTGWYLAERVRYAEAELLLQRSLAICEQQLGLEHLDTANSAITLGWLYRHQGRYAEAEPLYQRALAIREQQLGSEHPDTATSLNNLAINYDHQGKYAEAEPLYQRALAICEQQLGPLHRDTTLSLNNLAYCYNDQGRYAEAEPLYQRALAIYEQQLGPQHPSTVITRRNYVSSLQRMGRKAEAEQLEERSTDSSQQL